jgi:hypothetical protein
VSIIGHDGKNLKVAKELMTHYLRCADPSLTLTRTQYPAMVCNTRNRKPAFYAGFAISYHTRQPLTAHS